MKTGNGEGKEKRCGFEGYQADTFMTLPYLNINIMNQLRIRLIVS